MTQAAVVFDVAPGIRLAADTFGDSNAPTVLMLHGGGQTRHAWHATAMNLACWLASGHSRSARPRREHPPSPPDLRA